MDEFEEFLNKRYSKVLQNKNYVLTSIEAQIKQIWRAIEEFKKFKKYGGEDRDTLPLFGKE